MKRIKNSRFTITELVVAFLVISIIMAISINVVGVIGNTKLQNSSKKIWKQVHLTREYAVSKHQYIAILFPDNDTECKNRDFGGSSKSKFQKKFPRLLNRGIVACRIDRFNQFIEFIDNTQWVIMHENIVIELPPTSEGNMEIVDGVLMSNGETKSNGDLKVFVCDNIRAIIFTPTGSTKQAVDIGYNKTPIAVVEEIDSGKHLRAEISINWLTGKPRYENGN